MTCPKIDLYTYIEILRIIQYYSDNIDNNNDILLSKRWELFTRQIKSLICISL